MQGKSTSIDDVLSLPELEDLARRCAPPMAYEYVASGAGEEITIRWNRDGYERIGLIPRVLSGIDTVDTTISLLGTRMSFPILLAPTAYHRVLHQDGELATVRGANASGATLIVSSAANTPVEEIAAESTAPLWFQLYVQTDRGFTGDVIARARAAGCRALCLTVDTPVLGARNRQTKSGFCLPEGVGTPHIIDTGAHGERILVPTRVALSWRDVEWVRSMAGVPLVLKGILAAEDARIAVESGADALIVSNHGGRNLDTAIATVDALAGVVDAVSGRVPVLVDGGVRRGTDVIKAIALGASAVLIGRPYCYGLMVAGAEGVQRAVEILRYELEMGMILMGVERVRDISADLLAPAQRQPALPH